MICNVYLSTFFNSRLLLKCAVYSKNNTKRQPGMISPQAPGPAAIHRFYVGLSTCQVQDFFEKMVFYKF
jgi:hypothetical protein